MYFRKFSYLILIKVWIYRVYSVRVFNATFNNISAIAWQSVLLVEETGIPWENPWPAASHWQTLSHNVVSSFEHIKTILFWYFNTYPPPSLTLTREITYLQILPHQTNFFLSEQHMYEVLEWNQQILLPHNFNSCT